MALTAYQIQKIYEALSSKVKPCSSCGERESFVILNKVHLLELRDSPSSTEEAYSIVPCVVLTCSNCGHVQLHNVHRIGVAEVLGIPAPGEAI